MRQIRKNNRERISYIKDEIDEMVERANRAGSYNVEDIKGDFT